MQKIMTGKVKEVYEVDADTLEFAYTDNISVFDKIIPSQVPHKGETLCRTAKYWFNLMNEEGIRNDYIGEPSKDRMRVERVRIIRDYSQIDGSTTNYLIPLEVICRYYAAGSLLDRVKSGKVTAEQLGFPAGYEVKRGDRLPRPFIECTTKLEAHDENLTEEEAKQMAGLSDAEYREIEETVLRIDALIEREAGKRGLIHVDGKKEFGYDKDRNLMVVDTFGTLDEDRWWDAEEYAKGNIVELSKEFVRQYYRETGYHAALMEAREKGLEEPAIPALPQEIIDRVSRLYVDMYERITGEEFRPPSQQVREGQLLAPGAGDVGPHADHRALAAPGQPDRVAEPPVPAGGVVALRLRVRDGHALEQPLLGEYGRSGHLLDLRGHDLAALHAGALVLLGADADQPVAGALLEVVADAFKPAPGALVERPEVVEVGPGARGALADEGHRHRITPVLRATLAATSSDTPPSPRMVNLSERISWACDIA